jgi:hypothetical protein
MTIDAGEALFERHLKAVGYDIAAYQPDLGMAKRPDYLVWAAGHEVVVEVKSFNTSPTSAMPPDAPVDMTPKMRAVRNKVSAGAAQLNGIEGRPLVVVLANPRNWWVPLEGAIFLGALFGDPEARLASLVRVVSCAG